MGIAMSCYGTYRDIPVPQGSKIGVRCTLYYSRNARAASNSPLRHVASTYVQMQHHNSQGMGRNCIS